MPNWRILVVDDEEDIRTIIRASLSGKYEIVEATDGLDALEKLERVEPDFVILDVSMPLMDGYATCEAIRKNPKFTGINVLFLSALSSRDDMMKGYGAGANLYLTKPFEPPRLLRNVDVFFETYKVPYQKKRFTVDELQALEKHGAAEIGKAATPPPDRPTQSQASPSAPRRPDASAAPTPRPRVLVVDDDPDIRQVMISALLASYEICTAEDGIVAIERITRYQPDMVLIDAMMPKMSGYQLCQSLRRNARFAKTPILFISAKATPRDQDYALRIGANAFLAKPFGMKELRAKVEELTRLPDFRIHPKVLSGQQMDELESQRHQNTEGEQERAQQNADQNELEKFLRENT